MAIIDQFQICDTKPQKDKTPIGRFRRRLTRGIELQIELATAELAGQPRAATRKRWVSNKFTGVKELVETPLRVGPWWWKDDSGAVLLRLKYGSKTLEIAPGKSAIEIGDMASLRLDALAAMASLIKASFLHVLAAGRSHRARRRLRSILPHRTFSMVRVGPAMVPQLSCVIARA